MNKTAVIAGVVGVALLGLIAGAVVVSQQQQQSYPRPNVIIILWDTVRADRLSMYGYELETTPRMAQWAEEYGVVYEHCVSSGMWTVPSHASLFTGLAPTTHGAGFDHRWLDEHNLTLAEHFRDQGYLTYAFSANPNLSPNRVNLLQGFDHKDLSWGRKWKNKVVQHTRDKLLRRDKSTEISPAAKGKHAGVGYYNAGAVTHEALLRFVDQRPDPDQPFFAYLSYMEAHKPRVPTLSARKVVADRDTIKLGLETDLSFKAQLEYSYDKRSYTDEELVAINRVYDATLQELDDLTADLLDDLEARGMLEDTIIVFTSDHGEELGEHQQFGHRSGVYQQLLHVPLVIAYPRKLKPQRVETPVSNLDTFNTILELAGVPKPEGDYGRGNHADIRRIPKQAVFSESISIDRLGFQKMQKQFPDLKSDAWGNKYRAVIQDGWKLIQSVDFDTQEIVDHELFHVAEDRFEEHDVADQHPDRIASLDAAIAERWSGLRKWDPARKDEVGNDESDAMKKQLELLGYIEDDDEAGGEDTDAPPTDE